MRPSASVVVDTNVIIKLCDHDSYARRLRRYLCSRRYVYLVDVVEYEFEKHWRDKYGYDKYRISDIENDYGIRFERGTIITSDRTYAAVLEKRCPDFHSPDSLIAAFARRRMVRVLTFDVKMHAGCVCAGIKVKTGKSVLHA